jgi:hypothetical protein
MSSTIRKSATVIGITVTSAWLSGILYTYYSSRKHKYVNEFDTLFFTIEGLRNSFLIGGAIGFITGSVLTI